MFVQSSHKIKYTNVNINNGYTMGFTDNFVK